MVEEGVCEDKWGWLKPGSMSFRVRDAYIIEANWNNLEKWVGWKRIWSMRVQQRVKLFVWLLLHDGILTNSKRWKRNMASSAKCVRCGGVNEDATHAVRDCLHSREIWLAMGFHRDCGEFFNMELREWFSWSSKKRSCASCNINETEKMAIVC